MSDPCGTCARCCKSYVVTVCGYDVWLICTQLRFSPEQFLVVFPPAEPGLDSFLLESGGPPLGLMLDKQGPLKAKQPCIFLMHFGGGVERCGIYAQRPVVCQAYPMTLLHGDVQQRDNVLCPPDAWPAAAVRRPAWRAALQRQRMHFDIYRQAVMRWNARVIAAPGRQFSVAEYFSYLLNVYDRLARLDGEMDEDELLRVRDGWGLLRRTGASGESRPADGSPRQVRVPAGEFPWVDYLLRVKAMVDGFFPEVESQPLRLPATEEFVDSSGEDTAPTAVSDAGATRAAERIAQRAVEEVGRPC